MTRFITAAAICALLPGTAVTQEPDFPIEQETSRAMA
jgi:hypothetical protein